MPLRKIADLCTTDLILCEKMDGGLKLSTGINRSELVAYANMYGYLLPPEKVWPHAPGKSVPPLNDGKTEWHAWVQVLCASQGRAIMRARFVGDGFVDIPGHGQRGRWSYRLGPFTPESVAESYSNWQYLRSPEGSKETFVASTSFKREWLTPAGELLIHSETKADDSIEVRLNIVDRGGGLSPEVFKMLRGPHRKREELPDSLPGTIGPMLQAEIPWALTTDPLVAMAQMGEWADAAGDLLWRALTEIGELA